MIPKFFRWLLARIGVKNLLYISLLMLAVGSCVYGFSQVIRGLNFEVATQIAFFGLVLAWILAGTPIKNWVGFVLLLICGVIFLVVKIGNLLGPLISLFKVGNVLIWGYLNLEPGMSLDLTSFNLAYAEVYYSLEGIINAVWEWMVSLWDGMPIYEEVAILSMWGLLIWALSSWAGWVLRRFHQPFVSVLPAGGLLAAILSYTWAETGVMLPMIFAVLFLIAVVNFDQREENWLSAKMDYPENLSKEFGLVVFSLVFGLVVVAAFLPMLSIRNFLDYVQQFTKPQIEEAEPVIQSFGLEQNNLSREDIGKVLRAGFPRQHLLGSGPELAEKLVMTVQITGGWKGDPRRNITLPLYWRSLTYDEYSGYGWLSGDIILRSYEAGDQAVSKESAYHQMLQLDFRIAQGGDQLLYAAGDILTADEDFKIAYRPTVRYTEVLKAHGDFFGAAIEKNSYRVQSMIPLVSEADLQNASEDYPEWIIERYLVLPESIPTRVYRLADDLTKEYITPYEKVRRLEQYLRGFEYTLDVGLPDNQQDMVDYFLFDLQKGYCDYYASALVVMSRSLGIPSRLAIGYYRGSYDNVNNRYIVTEADAHSWVEVYFPAIGWVPFEPTAGRSEIERLIPMMDSEDGFVPVEQIRPSTPWYMVITRNWWIGSLYILTGVGVFVGLALAVDIVILRRMPPEKAIQTLYKRLFRFGRMLRWSSKKSDTPWEFATGLQGRLNWISRHGVLKGYIEASIEEISEITRIYTHMLYSSDVMDFSKQYAMLTVWQRLRRRLWYSIMQQVFLRERSPARTGGTNGEE